jgi:hypothetical protein
VWATAERFSAFSSFHMRAAMISFDAWGSQSWLQPAFRGGCAASRGRLKSRLQAELPAPPCCGEAALCYMLPLNGPAAWLGVCFGLSTG